MGKRLVDRYRTLLDVTAAPSTNQDIRQDSTTPTA
jgi:hypothetical protein